jgi:hypothetical protein
MICVTEQYAAEAAWLDEQPELDLCAECGGFFEEDEPLKRFRRRFGQVEVENPFQRAAGGYPCCCGVGGDRRGGSGRRRTGDPPPPRSGGVPSGSSRASIYGYNCGSCINSLAPPVYKATVTGIALATPPKYQCPKCLNLNGIFYIRQKYQGSNCCYAIQIANGLWTDPGCATGISTLSMCLTGTGPPSNQHWAAASWAGPSSTGTPQIGSYTMARVTGLLSCMSTLTLNIGTGSGPPCNSTSAVIVLEPTT